MMTFRFAKCVVAVGAIGLAAVLPSSAQAASATATAAAVVATATGMAKTVDMDFGTIAEAGAGTVVLATDGSRTTTGGGTGTPASFALSGRPNQAYAISLPDNVTLATGTTGLEMTAFTHDAGPTPTLNSTGSHGFNVGATLLVNGSRSGGADSGDSGVPDPTINVVVSYN